MRQEAGIGIRQSSYLPRPVTLGTPAAACDLHGSRISTLVSLPGSRYRGRLVARLPTVPGYVARPADR